MFIWEKFIFMEMLQLCQVHKKLLLKLMNLTESHQDLIVCWLLVKLDQNVKNVTKTPKCAKPVLPQNCLMDMVHVKQLVRDVLLLIVWCVN
jgi:hypothetical protein